LTIRWDSVSRPGCESQHLHQGVTWKGSIGYRGL